MDSSAARLSGRAQIVTKECDSVSPAKKSTSSRRTPSFSSSSSLSSCSSSLGSLHFPDDSPLSPATPLRFSGVPFSWEHLPGIPKKNVHKKKETALKQKQLPLPPTSMPSSSRKYNREEFGTRKKFSTESFRKDPFIAALVECSKDDHDDNDDDQEATNSRSSFFNGAKVTRSISDRFGFVSLYTSCKKTCAISESIVYLPRSSRTSYDLIHRRSR